MDQSLFIETVTPGLTALLVLTFVSVIVGVFIGVRALTHGRTVPLLGGVVVGPLGLAALGLSRWALSIGVVDEETAWRVVFGVVGPLLLVPFFAVVPAFLHGILAAVAGGRGPNRRWWVPAVAVAPMVGGRALFWFMLLDSVAIVETYAGRLELIARMRTELLATAELWSVVAVIAAMAVGVLGLVGMARGGRRGLHALLGGLWLVVTPLLLVLGDVPQSAWQQLTAYIPEVSDLPGPPAGAPAAPVAPERPAAPGTGP